MLQKGHREDAAKLQVSNNNKTAETIQEVGHKSSRFDGYCKIPNNGDQTYRDRHLDAPSCAVLRTFEERPWRIRTIRFIPAAPLDGASENLRSDSGFKQLHGGS